MNKEKNSKKTDTRSLRCSEVDFMFERDTEHKENRRRLGVLKLSHPSFLFSYPLPLKRLRLRRLTTCSKRWELCLAEARPKRWKNVRNQFSLEPERKSARF